MRHGRFLSAHADTFGAAGAIRAVYRKIHLYDVPMVGLVESQPVVLRRRLAHNKTALTPKQPKRRGRADCVAIAL